MVIKKKEKIDFKNKRKEIILLVICIILFIISLTQIAFIADYNNPKNEASPAIFLLLVGWLGAMDLGSGISWVANPFLFLSWIKLFRNLKLSILFSFIASLFSFSFLFFNKILSDEAGHYSKIISHESGYWFWLSSCLFTLCGTLFIYFKNKKVKI